MKCRYCKKEIIKIATYKDTLICDAEPLIYWLSRNPTTSVVTPNGETIKCVLNGDNQEAHGVGFALHSCRFDEEGGSENG